jgi:hypothetical protein
MPSGHSACTRGVRGPGTADGSPFDFTQTPVLTVGPPGYFVGDDMLMAAAGKQFANVFSQPREGDPDAVFAGPASAGHR